MERHGNRQSDIIYVSREATYTLMKFYKCANCSDKIFAMYEIAKRSVMISCRKCKHFETTEKSESARSFLIAHLGDEKVNFILDPKKKDPLPISTKKDDTILKEDIRNTKDLLSEIDNLLDNIKT
jgi:DNA-directed RNA polymerase subunit RPC12/RpoP